MKEWLNLPLKTNKNEVTNLNKYKNKVLLVVNVASKCGLTPQYEKLEKIFRQYKDQGFEILAFPTNDFMGQEPGSDQEIAEFCQSRYDVSFPLFQKISVLGPHQAPLYQFLTKTIPVAKTDSTVPFFKKILFGTLGLFKKNNADISWNFEKFLIDRQGNIVDRFSPTVPPDSPLITSQIENLL